MNGKGSTQRPRAVSREEWEARHEQTFGKKSEPLPSTGSQLLDAINTAYDNALAKSFDIARAVRDGRCTWPECGCYSPQGPQGCQKEDVDG